MVIHELKMVWSPQCKRTIKWAVSTSWDSRDIAGQGMPQKARPVCHKYPVYCRHEGKTELIVKTLGMMWDIGSVETSTGLPMPQ